LVVDLFVIYLTKLTVAQAINRFMNTEFEMMWQEAVVVRLEE
jgi:hypothetical protein